MEILIEIKCVKITSLMDDENIDAFAPAFTLVFVSSRFHVDLVVE